MQNTNYFCNTPNFNHFPQVWFQNRRARSIKTGRLPKSPKPVLGGRAVIDPSPGPVTPAFLASTTLADIFRPEQNHSCEDVSQMYSDWIQIYSNPVSSPPSSSSLQQQQIPLGSSKPPESRLLEEEQHHQRQHLGTALPSFLPCSFHQPITRQHQHSTSTRSYQTFRNFKPQTMAPSGGHQAVYGGSVAGHTSVDQIVPSHPQSMYWEVAQGQGHHHHHPHHHHHHPQMGPQTSMGYISDLIYNAAIVTNFLEFWSNLFKCRARSVGTSHTGAFISVCICFHNTWFKIWPLRYQSGSFVKTSTYYWVVFKFLFIFSVFWVCYNIVLNV